MTSLQPGSMNSAQYVLKLMFIGTITGIVSATSRPPASAAMVDGLELPRDPLRVPASRRSARSSSAGAGRPTDIWVKSSISSSLNLSRQPSTIASSVVPSWSRTAPHSASTSSWLAHRDATGFPSPSEWVYESVVEKPSPPASIDSSSSRHHRGDLVLGRLALDRFLAHDVARGSRSGRPGTRR